MERARTLILLLLALPVSAVAWALPPADNEAARAPVAVNGVYLVDFNVNLGSTVPAGTMVTCKARIAPNLAPFENPGTQLAGPVATATGVTTIKGSATHCALEIPFSWTVGSGRNGVLLSYEIDAVSPSGSQIIPVQASARQGITLPYPPVGAATRLSLNVTL